MRHSVRHSPLYGLTGRLHLFSSLGLPKSACAHPLALTSGTICWMWEWVRVTCGRAVSQQQRAVVIKLRGTGRPETRLFPFHFLHFLFLRPLIQLTQLSRLENHSEAFLLRKFGARFFSIQASEHPAGTWSLEGNGLAWRISRSDQEEA